MASTAQSESPTTQTNSATSPDEAAVPVVSENAAAEVPGAEVASQNDLAAAMEESQAGPSPVPTDVTSNSQQPSQGARSTVGRARQQKKPRTVEVAQLVPGAEFEGTIVRKPCRGFTLSPLAGAAYQCCCPECAMQLTPVPCAGFCHVIWCICGRWSCHGWLGSRVPNVGKHSLHF